MSDEDREHNKMQRMEITEVIGLIEREQSSPTSENSLNISDVNTSVCDKCHGMGYIEHGNLAYEDCDCSANEQTDC